MLLNSFIFIFSFIFDVALRSSSSLIVFPKELFLKKYQSKYPMAKVRRIILQWKKLSQWNIKYSEVLQIHLLINFLGSQWGFYHIFLLQSWWFSMWFWVSRTLSISCCPSLNTTLNLLNMVHFRVFPST